MLKISTKISLFYLAATAAIIVLMAASMYFIYYTQRLQSIDTELQDYSSFLTYNMKIEEFNLSHIFGVINEKKGYSKQSFINNYQFAVTDNDSIIFESNNNVVLDSLIKPIIGKNHYPNHKDFRSVEFNKIHYRTYTKIIKLPNKSVIEIIMIASLEKFYESLNLLKYILFIISPGFLLIAFFIGSIIAKKSFVPVMQIIHASEIITADNLDKRVPVGSNNDEISHLANTLNDMIDRLDKTFKSQKQFIADASHDFRTPLTVMRLEFEILLSKREISEEIRTSLIKSLQEVKSLSNLADNLLLLAKADSNQLILNKENFRFDELLIEIIGNFNVQSSNKGVSFRIDIENDYEIYADRELIKRVLNNLFDNAVKYSLSNSIISVNIFDENKYLILEIINYCNPFPHEFLNQITDRFQRAQHSRTTEGFGLGLPIVKTIVEAHEGQIKLDLKVNIFTISIKLKKYL